MLRLVQNVVVRTDVAQHQPFALALVRQANALVDPRLEDAVGAQHALGLEARMAEWDSTRSAECQAQG
jgi:hypothetical protein